MYGVKDEGLGEDHIRYVWAAECKYRKQPMTPNEIRKAVNAANALKQDEAKYGANVELTVWLVSTGGFTADAMDILKKGNNTLYTDYQVINELFRLYGGNIKIPIFVDEAAE